MVPCFFGGGKCLEIYFSETIVPFKKYLIDGCPQNVCFCANLKSKMAVTTGHSVALASNGKINKLFLRNYKLDWSQTVLYGPQFQDVCHCSEKLSKDPNGLQIYFSGTTEPFN